MLTIAALFMIVAFLLSVLWPTPEPALVCLGISVVSLVFKFLP